MRKIKFGWFLPLCSKFHRGGNSKRRLFLLEEIRLALVATRESLGGRKRRQKLSESGRRYKKGGHILGKQFFLTTFLLP